MQLALKAALYVVLVMAHLQAWQRLRSVVLVPLP